MEKIKPLRRYTLVDERSNSLHLFLGQKEDWAETSKDKGYRWMFKGFKIPMPVRSETWFNGFPVDTMLDWLKGNGWTLHSVLDLTTDKLTVYKYVGAPDTSKGNNGPVSTGNENLDGTYYRNFCSIIKELCEAGRKIPAVRLYRYVHGGSLSEANNAVNAIHNNP